MVEYESCHFWMVEKLDIIYIEKKGQKKDKKKIELSVKIIYF